jgi:hypothetical protein
MRTLVIVLALGALMNAASAQGYIINTPGQLPTPK